MDLFLYEKGTHTLTRITRTVRRKIILSCTVIIGNTVYNETCYIRINGTDEFLQTIGPVDYSLKIVCPTDTLLKVLYFMQSYVFIIGSP